MIVTKQGDLLKSTGFIVHGCNSHGIMGSGIAKQIKDKWVKVYDRYKTMYTDYRLPLGSLTYVRVLDNTLVINAITQKDYGRSTQLYVSYSAIEIAFTRINQLVMESAQYKSIPRIVNFPLIGCGLANGDWNTVAKIIDHTLDDSITKILWVQK